MGFRKVRVFVSSTFRDMNAERDHLVRVVFPRVKEYCDRRFLEFVPIDLRWGIPEEDSRNGLVLNACLQEVDNTRPFFIGILGSRYGWTPSEEELDVLEPSLHKEKPWLRDRISHGASITEMEMDYAVLRDMDVPQARFFIRSDRMEVPADFREPEGSDAMRKLEALKDKIRSQRKYPVADYDSPEQLGEMIYKELIAMIDAEYPPSAEDETLSVVAPHEQALAGRSESLCDISMAMGDFERWNEGGNRIYLISGWAGYGTSTLLCCMISHERKLNPDVNIAYFDFESVPSGENAIASLTRFLNADVKTVREMKILALDNVSILEIEEIEELTRIIDSLDESVRIMMAIAQGSKANDAIRFKYDPAFSTIHGFTPAQRREYVTNYAARYGKRLTEEQTVRIADCKTTQDPTFLRMLMEAVVSHGVFETIDKRIDELLKTPDADFMFYAIMEDYDRDYAKAHLFWPYFYGVTAVSLSRKGISEKDIMEAYGISQAEWSAVRPGVMRFCKGTPDRLMLVRESWNHQVKMYWSTYVRAQAGKKLTEWILAAPERRESRGEIVASVYRDIWHLPFALDNDEEDRRLCKEYISEVNDYFFSPEAVLTISQASMAVFTSSVLRKGVTPGQIEERMRNNFFTPGYKDYYTKLAKAFAASGRKELSLTAMKILLEVMEWRGDADAPLIKAELAIEEGRPEEALSILDAVTDTEGRAVEIMSLCIKAWCRGGNWEMLRQVNQAIDEDTLFSDEDITDDNYMIYSEALMEMNLTFSIFGNEESRKYLFEIMQEIEPSFRGAGLYNPATYNYLMIRSIFAFLMKDFARLRFYSYYAYKSASEVYSARLDCYQFGRAANFFAIAVYFQDKEYLNWRNSAYIQNRYDPLAYQSGYPEGAEAKAISVADDVNRFYEWTISTIQPK